jgi:hypothetical protein
MWSTLRSRLVWGLFALSGLVPLLALLESPPEPTLLIYTVFVGAVFWQRRARGRKGSVASPWRPQPVRFWLALLGTAALTETLAWTGHFLKCSPEPALLHPQLLADLIQAFGFYSSWAVAWLLLLSRFRFELPEVFAVQAAYGVLLEQQGQIFLAGLATMPLGLILWLFVALVYGSTIGIPYSSYGPGWSRNDRSGSRWKYPIALLALFLAIVPIGGTWGALTQAVGLVPPPGPICERPLW